MANKAGQKIRDAVEEEVIAESVGAYRKWVQKSKNGILPIGIAEVGKTTLLSKYDVHGPNVFLDFNRTIKVNVDAHRLRDDFSQRCRGVEYIKTIDVPGELPEQWAMAYFTNNPRVLVIMVDDREPQKHITEIQKFLLSVREGPTFWQKALSVIKRTGNNLSRVIFVVNKVDRIEPDRRLTVMERYRALLADIHSALGTNILLFQVSLQQDDTLHEFFAATLDGLTRK